MKTILKPAATIIPLLAFASASWAGGQFSANYKEIRENRESAEKRMQQFEEKQKNFDYSKLKTRQLSRRLQWEDKIKELEREQSTEKPAPSAPHQPINTGQFSSRRT